MRKRTAWEWHELLKYVGIRFRNADDLLMLTARPPGNVRTPHFKKRYERWQWWLAVLNECQRRMREE